MHRQGPCPFHSTMSFYVPDRTSAVLRPVPCLAYEIEYSGCKPDACKYKAARTCSFEQTAFDNSIS